jgi:hypothetical protein
MRSATDLRSTANDLSKLQIDFFVGFGYDGVFKDLMQRSSNYGMYLLITLTLK